MLDKQKEEKIWFDLYMTFNDYNEMHAELSFISNGYAKANITAEDLFKANQEFIKEIMDHGYTEESIIEEVPETADHFPVD